MYKGYQEAEEPQQDQSADAAAAANHGGCDGRQSDRAKRLRNSSSSDFKRVNPPGRGAGEDVQGSAGGGGERQRFVNYTSQRCDVLSRDCLNESRSNEICTIVFPPTPPPNGSDTRVNSPTHQTVLLFHTAIKKV
ncbi:hypothetical protein F2P81_000576 [Scophthalmus maximus]|uniref:Uncharacterized protein n=1 Tax=Scophthalmus maximus TaxID=52904 RepID=A0A6A4TLG1_SCOMX|nr:hypothetical protein F2P81_000576 [Scophthalmus maximus]